MEGSTACRPILKALKAIAPLSSSGSGRFFCGANGRHSAMRRVFTSNVADTEIQALQAEGKPHPDL
jgi:hypothetical protein